ncbi:hypothetical protein V499_08177 [Pseudogymnoascus sp. VKM F-103]|nr:hypothetical protein V499_08177 [Pseudogymnoascus sp. VKM F-103]
MVAGLAIQVASLTAFTIIGVEFALRVYKNRNHLNPTHADVYNSQRFKLFLGGLTLATVCVFTRSVFRAAELSGGFAGHLANNEVSFMILDGAMIMIACGAFTLLHPGYCFTKAGWAAATYPFFNKNEEKIARNKARDERREVKQQAIIDAKEKRFNRGPKVVPLARAESGENTGHGSDGSLGASEKIPETVGDIQKAPHAQ